jgi:hypothetical protein
MNFDTPSNSEKRSDFCASNAIGTVADLQIKAYESRVRERLRSIYPTPTPAEARRLEKQIEKLVQIYAQGRIVLVGVPSEGIRRDPGQRGSCNPRELNQ